MVPKKEWQKKQDKILIAPIFKRFKANSWYRVSDNGLQYHDFPYTSFIQRKKDIQSETLFVALNIKLILNCVVRGYLSQKLQSAENAFFPGQLRGIINWVVNAVAMLLLTIKYWWFVDLCFLMNSWNSMIFNMDS